jgi:SNF2 family DNA or RNA helicase
MDAQKIIVICPSDTMDNFIREIKLWTPHRLVMKLGKMPKAERDFVLPPLKHVPQFVLVFNYEAWRRDPDFIQDIINLKPDTVVYDEAHKAKTWTTATCQGIQDIVFGLNLCPSCRSDNPDVELDGRGEEDRNYATCMKCGYQEFITEFCSVKNVIPMTGTPILNKPQELFPHLRVIDPKNFVDEKTYLRDFCYKSADGKWRWQWGAEEKLAKKIGPRYIARDRKSAGIIIPPATPIEHLITKEEFKEGYPKQYKAYEQVRQYAQLVLDPDKDITMAMPYMIVVLMRLRQCLVWPAGIELKHKDEDGNEKIVARLNVYESVKLDKAQELISEITEEGESVLGFSMFKEPLYELERRLGKRALAYTGDTVDHLKNQAQLDFDPKTAPVNPKWDALLGTYGAMGVGLNLNRATHEVMLDRYWNPGGEDQAEGRIDRIGTTKDTYIHRIMVEGTIDTWMNNLINQKKDLIEGFSTQADLFQEVYRALREGEI